MSRSQLALASLLAPSLVALVGAPAQAYRQTKTCMYPEERDANAPSTTPDCQPDETPWPIAWPDHQITYVVYEAGTSDVPGEPGGSIDPALLDVLRASIELWNEPPCSGFGFVYAGLSPKVRHDPADRVNLITFVDQGWEGTRSSLAVTLTTVRLSDGRLMDADMEINSEFHDFALLDGPGSASVDVANTITHEAGHMLGLDHSAVREATMQFEAPSGEVRKRDLAADDIAGLCAIYPVGAPSKNEVDDEDDDEGCCATAPAAPSPQGPLWALLAGLAITLGLRRSSLRPRS